MFTSTDTGPLTTITATDADAGAFGTVTYSLRAANGVSNAAHFTISASTGVVTTAAVLDRENIDE